MFARIGRAVVLHPWRVIAVWIVAAIAVIATSPGLSSSSNESDFLPRNYESIQAQDLQTKAFPQSFSASAIMVFQRADGGTLTAGDAAAVKEIATQLQDKKIADIERIVAADPSANKAVQLAMVQMPDMTMSNQNHLFDAVKALRADAKPLAKDAGLTVGIGGSVADGLDQQDASSNASAIVFIATIGLIIVLLLIIFRSPIIALLPVILIAIVSQVANGLIADISKAFDLKTDSSITELLIVVLFGIGTDYILFLMFRYRERLRQGDHPKQAMINAVTRVGEAIASAAGVVIIAFLALTLSTLGMFRSMGPALAIAVAVTLLAGLTLVPAVVSLLGTRVFWPSKAWQKEPTGARYAAIGRSMARRPAAFAGVAGLVMVALAIGVINYHPTFDLSSSSIPSTAESQVAEKDMLKGFPAGESSPTDVYVTSTSGAPLDESALPAYRQRLESVRGVGSVAPATFSADHKTALFQVTLTNDPSSDTALATVKGPLRATAHASPDGTKALVGGLTAVYVDIQHAMDRDYTVVFPVAALLIMVILGLLLRSLVAPWYLMASVVLGFGATLGATTLLFQDVRGESGLMFMLPLIMYMFVVALGTDYNILMVARLREEAKEGRSPREAAAMALRHTGPTIGAAGLILAGSFASLILAGNSLLSEMGFAISFGIAVAAFVMASFFTPALTALIGRAAWWPGHSNRDRARPAETPEPVSIEAR